MKFSVLFLSMALIISSCGSQVPIKSVTDSSNMDVVNKQAIVTDNATNKQSASFSQIALAKRLLEERVGLKIDYQAKKLDIHWEKSVTFTLNGNQILAAPLDNKKYIVIGLKTENLGFDLLAMGSRTTNADGKVELLVTDLNTGTENNISESGKLYFDNFPAKKVNLNAQGNDKPNCGDLKNKVEEAKHNASVAQVAAIGATVVTAHSILYGTPFIVVAVAEVIGTDKLIAHAIHETKKANEAKKEYHNKCEVPKKK
jgi:hypothetical protein